MRHSTIRKLAASKIIQPGLFDSHGIASVTTPDLPAERLLVCFNPLVAAERKRKRNALLDSTETAARVMAAAYATGKFDRDELNRRLGTLRRHKMGKHFCWQFEESTLAFCSTRNEQSIQAEASLDGIYVILTSLASETLADRDVVRTNKSLARVERAFRSLKTTRLKLRPVFHWRQNRVQAHLFLCMLAYYLEWHMRLSLAPLLFAEEGKQPSPASPVGPAERSDQAKRKDCTRVTSDGLLPVQSFPDLLSSLSSLTTSELSFKQIPNHRIPRVSEMTPLHRKAFDLLDFQPHPAPGLATSPDPCSSPKGIQPSQ